MKRLTRMVCVLLATLIFFSSNIVAYAQTMVNVADVTAYFQVADTVTESNRKVPFSIHTNVPAKQLKNFNVKFKIKDKLHNGDKITINKDYNNWWTEVSYAVYVCPLNENGNAYGSYSTLFTANSQGPKEYNGPVTIELTEDYEYGVQVLLQLTNKVTYANYVDENIVLGINVLNYDIEYKTNGLLGDIISYIKGLFEKISNLPQEIKSFINNLGDRISSFFSDLANKISVQFDKLKNNIQTFFNTLGDRISSFFNDLKNKLLNFGNNTADYQFSSGLTDVINSLNSYIDKLNDTLVQIDNAKKGVQQYLNHGNEFLNGFLRSTPVAVIAVLVFGVVFIFVRKVVGR